MIEQTPFLTPEEQQLSEATEHEIRRAKVLRDLAQLSVRLHHDDTYFGQVREYLRDLPEEQIVRIGAHATMLTQLLPEHRQDEAVPIQENPVIAATLPLVPQEHSFDEPRQQLVQQSAETPLPEAVTPESHEPSMSKENLDRQFSPIVSAYLEEIGYLPSEYSLDDIDELANDIVEAYMKNITAERLGVREKFTKTIQSFLRGDDRKEIAESHGVSYGAVSQRLNAVKNTLKIRPDKAQHTPRTSEVSAVRPLPSAMPRKSSALRAKPMLVDKPVAHESEATQEIAPQLLDDVARIAGIAEEDRPMFLQHFAATKPVNNNSSIDDMKRLRRSVNRLTNYVNDTYGFLNDESLGLTPEEQMLMRRVCASWYIDPHTKQGTQVKNPVMTPVYDVVGSSRRDSAKSIETITSALSKIAHNTEPGEEFEQWRKRMLEQLALSDDETAAFARWIDYQNTSRERDATTKKALNTLQTRLSTKPNALDALDRHEQAATRMTLVDMFGTNTLEVIAETISKETVYDTKAVEEAILKGVIALGK